MAIDPQTQTTDYRKYPKGPNFLGIVIGASVVLVILLVAAWLLLRTKAGKLGPHPATSTPNALVIAAPETGVRV
jgi:hypothetical protein